MGKKLDLRALTRVNTELWLILSLFVLAAGVNFLVSSHHMVLGFYSLPTILSAYAFGRRHAVLTAVASIVIVGLVIYDSPQLLNESAAPVFFLVSEKWFEIVVWGGTLVITAYLMGTLYDKQKAQVRELRETYNGVLLILQQFIAKDKYTQNHSYRVSVYATKIAMQMGLPNDTVEDIRAAALIHDLGKLEVSREILYKAARLTASEYNHVQQHVDLGVQMLKPVGGPLSRVIPIILAHHDKFDGSGYHETQGEDIPLEARILSVADVFDALTSDRPYRKAMSPLDAKESIVKASGTDFDPRVVDAFASCFRLGLMDIPEVMV